MKRILLPMFLLPLLAGLMPVLSSCQDDSDSLPPVDIDVTLSGCTVVSDEIYVVQSEGFKVDAVTMDNHGNKRAMIGTVSYFWDYMHVGSTAETPFSYEFEISPNSIGTHLFQVECQIFAVDYAPAVGLLTYKIHVVESEADIPGGDAPHSTALTLPCRIQSVD